MVGERWKDDQGRVRIGRPLNQMAPVGFYQSYGINDLTRWVPLPFDNEGRRVIRVKRRKV